MSAPTPEERMAGQFDRARDFFEPQLRKLGLDVDSINHQTLDELHRSLGTINDLIAHPESFGAFKISASGGLAILSTTVESQVEIGPLPILLERKQLILQRIAALRGEQKIHNLRDLAAQVADEELKAVLEKEITDLEESKQYQQQADKVEKEREAVVARYEEDRHRVLLELERFERRSKVWQRFLERESVATIVGALLLVMLAIVLTIAMFTNVAVSAVISNSFLLILGYFFGQTVARGARSETS